ncbi:hypothetical protein COV15_02110 [Candidatus Woesearchaeota archaeon CG10_big_fil_rev_8_21_14_0_10_34_12]|nr:MAG: hypothetical protein COV15_02110 [Candidatus Woesearchaeota archaeon CG10_big_fil_rev_8_21_14_0_10_34_12]
MELEEVQKMLLDHEKRIAKLESENIPSTGSKKTKKELNPGNNKYKGLAGGLRFLINEGFLNEPKSIPEIEAELKREGYHYSTAGVASTLSETFTKSQKVLNRVKDGKIWRYVIRK